MRIKAKDTRRMMTLLDPNAFRYPQRTDHFKVKLTTDARQYVIVNDGHAHDTMHTVTFRVTESGKRLVSCTCYDFAYHRVHLRQCKHIHVAFYFHIERMKAQKKAVAQQQG